MTKTTPSSPSRRRFRRVALAGAIALGTIAGLVPTAPAGAAVPTVVRILDAYGYDQAGPNGYHVVSWNVPGWDGDTPVLEYQIERWNLDLTQKLGTFNQPVGTPHRTFAGLPDNVVFQYRVRARNADGWSAWGDYVATKTFVGRTHLHPYTDVDDFIDRQVSDFGVNLSIGQESTWRLKLKDRQGVTEFIDFLASRTERRNRAVVIRLYFAYFDRAPEAAGLDFWENELDTGKAGLGKVSQFFSGSQEFTSKYGGTSNSQFVTLVYQNVLFRDPEPGGLAYWKGRLDQGTINRGNLMIGFSESPEGKDLRAADVVFADTWAAMFGSIPTNLAVNVYAAHVEAGGTAGDLAADFLRSEYYPAS